MVKAEWGRPLPIAPTNLVHVRTEVWRSSHQKDRSLCPLVLHSVAIISSQTRCATPYCKRAPFFCFVRYGCLTGIRARGGWQIRAALLDGQHFSPKGARSAPRQANLGTTSVEFAHSQIPEVISHRSSAANFIFRPNKQIAASLTCSFRPFLLSFALLPPSFIRRCHKYRKNQSSEAAPLSSSGSAFEPLSSDSSSRSVGPCEMMREPRLITGRHGEVVTANRQSSSASHRRIAEMTTPKNLGWRSNLPQLFQDGGFQQVEILV